VPHREQNSDQGVVGAPTNHLSPDGEQRETIGKESNRAG